MARLAARHADFCFPFAKKGWVALPHPLDGFIRYPRLRFGSPRIPPRLAAGPITVEDNGELTGYVIQACRVFSRKATISQLRALLPLFPLAGETDDAAPIGLLIPNPDDEQWALSEWAELLRVLQTECSVEDLTNEVVDAFGL